MGRRRQLSFLVLPVLAGAVVATRLLLSSVFFEGFLQIERTQAEEQVRRLEGALSADLRHLEGQLAEWARSDARDTFAGAGAGGLPEHRVTGALFTALDLDLIGAVGEDGQPRGAWLAAWGDSPYTMPEPMLRQILEYSALFPHGGARGGETGILLLGGRPVMFATHPVKPDADAPPRGAVFFGRWLDDAVVRRISDMTLLDVSQHSVPDPRLSPELQRARVALLETGGVHVEPMDEQRIAGAVLVHDPLGRPVVMLSAVMPRTIHAQGQETGRYIVAIGLLAGSILLLALWWLLRSAARSTVAQRDTERLMRAFVDQSTDGVVVFDPAAGRVLEMNEAARQLLGEAGCLNPSVLLAQAPEAVRGRPGSRAAVGTSIVQHEREPGDLLDLELAVSAVQHGRRSILVVVLRDVTQRKRTEEHILKLAYLDPLTRLANRSRFHERLDGMLGEAATAEGGAGLILIDLDFFKAVNDTLGHTTGDKLLQIVGSRLQQVVREHDLVARLGGDEFAVLLSRLPAPDMACVVAGRINEVMREPISVSGRLLYASVSIGVAVAPFDGLDAQTLYRSADLALHNAKDMGRDRWRRYAPELNDQAIDLLVLKTELLEALEREEFFLEYQPQVDGNTGEIIGVEALLRWRSPTRGVVPPGRFIPCAEQTGIIVQIGNMVLRTACAQVKAWTDAGYPAIRVAVNLSPKQFQQQNLVEQVRLIIEETGIAPGQVELEVTESVAVKHPDRARATLLALKALGVKLALDDFGTGYSSIAALRQYPFDRLKIDRSFLNGASERISDRSFVHAIIMLGHALEMEVVAEGVETEYHIALLRSLGCPIMQGFGIARPMSVENVTQFLQQRVAHLTPVPSWQPVKNLH